MRTRLPGWLREEVWFRDEGRCVFRDDGVRCGRGHDLEVIAAFPIEPGCEGDPRQYELMCPPHAALCRAILRWDPQRRGFGEA